MAYLFDDASTMYLESDSANGISGAPLTMAAWFRSNDDGNPGTLISLVDKDANDEFYLLLAAGSVGGDPIRFNLVGAGVADTSTGFSANTWHHACGVAVASDDRAVFIDGGSKGTSTVGGSQAAFDRTTIGRNGDSTPSGEMSGDIAEASIWDVALTDAEVAWLGLGYSALTLTHRLSNLVFHRDLIRDLNRPYIGANLTAFNTPTVSNHTRIYYPSAPMIISAAAAAAALTTGEIMAAISGHLVQPSLHRPRHAVMLPF